MLREPINVLLIEDNPGDARLIRELLADEAPDRFRLEHVDQLATGLERLSTGGVDVVLLDLMLPDSQGLETFDRVRAQSPRLPVVVLTGLDDDAVATETLHAGGQDYLTKGILVYTLLHRLIRHAIERQRAADVSRRAGERLT